MVEYGAPSSISGPMFVPLFIIDDQPFIVAIIKDIPSSRSSLSDRLFLTILDEFIHITIGLLLIDFMYRNRSVTIMYVLPMPKVIEYCTWELHLHWVNIFISMIVVVLISIMLSFPIFGSTSGTGHESILIYGLDPVTLLFESGYTVSCQ